MKFTKVGSTNLKASPASSGKNGRPKLTEVMVVHRQFDLKKKDGFYAYYLNQRIVCASVSQCNTLREANLMSTHVQYEQMFSMDYRSFCDFHDEQMAAAQTGNHQPRNHAVRVPTRAGEPVRG